MLRRLLIVAAIAVAAPLAFSGTAYAASCTLSAPLTGDTYVNTVYVSWSCTTAPTAADLVWTYVAGPYAGSVSGPVTTTLALSGNSSGSFAFAPPTASSSASFSSVSGALPDGTWDVHLQGTIGGTTYNSSTHTNVEISTATAPPTLTSPAAGATQNTIPVSLSMPDTPSLSPDAVSLTFTNTSTSAVSTLYLTYAHQSQAFTLNPADLSASSTDIVGSSGPNTLPDGSYDVTFAYADDLGHPAASVTNDDWTLETATAAPTLPAPSGGTDGSPLAIQYTLPDLPLANSATLTFSGPTTVTVTLDASLAGSGSLTLDPADLLASPGVTSVSPAGATLPDGTYDVTLAYQDFLGNPVSSTVQTGVVISSAPAAPAATAPAETTPATTAPATTAPAGAPVAPAPTIAPAILPSSAFTLMGAAHRGGGGSITVAVRVPGAGTVDLLGTHSLPRGGSLALTHSTRLAPGWHRLAYGRASQTASGAGVLSVTLEPNAQGRLLIARERRLHNPLQVRVWITFTPTGGTPRSRWVIVHVLSGRR